MSISLGGLALNDHISWTNYNDDAQIAWGEMISIGGVRHINSSPVNFRSITLEAIEEDNIRKGFFTHEQVMQFILWRDQQALLTLIYHSIIIDDLLIRPDGINLKKTLWKSDFLTTDRYIGTLNLAQ